MLVNAQRFVVTREPLPAAKVAEAPPAPQASEVDRPAAPQSRRGLGRSALDLRAHRLLLGRWPLRRTTSRARVRPATLGVLDGQHFFFTGFYVPYGVYVRSHFNRYYYSGMPKNRSRPTQGPYWPIGAPTRANSALTSANARDPYWPIGVRR